MKQTLLLIAPLVLLAGFVGAVGCCALTPRPKTLAVGPAECTQAPAEIYGAKIDSCQMRGESGMCAYRHELPSDNPEFAIVCNTLLERSTCKAPWLITFEICMAVPVPPKPEPVEESL